MRVSKTFASAMMVIAGAMTSSAAFAHPGAKLLTTGGKGERTAMTAGVSFEDINGVHVFRGGGQKEDALLGGDSVAAPASCDREIEIIIHERPWRSFRRLRTQGFYSGYAYPSRRYTQGFYSGHR
ncbi:hypothetical protein [Hyphococcus sp.]|uniref:hypothetical protein n=1 Tax=Hyphococcus sp. TaxID=2038636 RepID=UPI00208AEFD0|nr:MAG: hypothetical protein DHS20C04_01390 [Marinicaulis sp.]